MAEIAGYGEIVFYQRDHGTPGIDVRMDGGTVWLTQAQRAEFFQTTPQNITLHLKAIFAEGELTESATCKDYLQARQEGARQVERNLRHFNLVMGGKPLQGAGKVSHEQALNKAEAEYIKFRAQVAEQPSEVETAFLKTVKAVLKKITGKKKP